MWRMRQLRSGVLAGTVLLLGTCALSVVPTASAAPPSTSPHRDGGHCSGQHRLSVPGAEHQEVACLEDLTTAGTTASGHTNPADWAGLHAPGTENPSGVPGVQIDGYFPDSSTSNTNNGWHHDSQFVIRIPDDWNGRLVVTGAPGNRAQYANDFVIGDHVLAAGYAFASTDKGNVGQEFYDDGSRPGGSVAEWNRRVTQLTRATKAVLRRAYGPALERTYMFGISNGGYLTRWQLENRPGLYDGGVDWEGTLFRADGPNLMTYLPTALRAYPRYVAGDESARREMHEAGFAEGSEFLWQFHHEVYWGLTQRIYREEFDPGFDGDDAHYDYDSRPAAVKRAVRRVELTGKLKKPMLTVHGTLDALLPPATDSDVYAELVREQGRDENHRYYRVEDGTHTDGLYGYRPGWEDELRPLLPCARSAFEALTAWVEDGTTPPASGFYPRPDDGTDLVNTCEL